MRTIPLALWATACLHAPPAVAPVPDGSHPLRGLVLEPLPLWSRAYSVSATDEGTRFRIPELMHEHRLSRLDAVELQNHYRDLERTTPDADPGTVFRTALSLIRGGRRESGLDPDALAAAAFIVVFDVDDTLLDQRYPLALQTGCHTHAVREHGMQLRFLHLAPGWDEAFAAVRDAGGKIVIFSANTDDNVLGNMGAITWEGHPLTEHPDILGVLTNSHLVSESKLDGGPVTEPSKDLRIFDETLSKVVLIDDNPYRTFQPANLRLPARFQADVWCDPTAEPALRAAMGTAMHRTALAVTDAAAWSSSHGTTFRDAFLPYTWAGSLTVDAIAESTDHDWPAAMTWVRHHPESVTTRF